MKLAGVISLRNILRENFREIVFEWEDAIVKQQGGVLKFVSPKIFSFPYKVMRRVNYHEEIPKINKREDLFLAFCMNIDEVEYYRGNNIVPVFIDIWPKDITHFCEKVIDNFAIVTSLDIFRLVKPKCRNVHYLPLSISDKWKLDSLPIKRPILVQLGRKNEILHKFALQFVNEYPKYEYIYANYDEGSKQLIYYSTQKGHISTPENREEYMDILKQAAVCILSSPGMDKSRVVAGEIDYPTPRFYETAINYCHMLARYGTDHDEFKIQGITNICDSIKDFSEFKIKALLMLSKNTIDKDKYDIFIAMHLTSTWIEDLNKVLNKNLYNI